MSFALVMKEYLIPVCALGFCVFFLHALTFLINNAPRWPQLVLMALSFVGNYLLFQNDILLKKQGIRSGLWLDSAVFYVLAVDIALCVLFIQHANQMKQLDNRSVKEGVDSLSDGLLYYFSDGQIKLLNSTMNEIIQKEKLGEIWNGVRIGEKLLEKGQVHLNGKTYAILGNTVHFEEEDLREILALDITSEEKLHEELKQRNEDLRKQGEQLKRLSETIRETGIAEEILKARISVHDDYSALIFQVQRYLKGENITYAELRKSWNRVYAMYRNKVFADHSTAYDVLFRSAKDLGVELEIEGKLPKQEHLKKILIRALREFMANTIKHAHGDKIFVSVSENDPEHVTLILKHNGLAPSGVITERGGLKNLRSYIESSGGTMELLYAPEFALKIVAAKEV